jgi:DNA (cytosine-5)-methyltransferase 1
VTKDRFGLVTVVIDGDRYAIADIFLRMLKPEELKLMQGFPEDYIINRDADFNPYPKTQQIARIGNSVVPIMAKVLVEANCGCLKVGERHPNPVYAADGNQLRFIV